VPGRPTPVGDDAALGIELAGDDAAECPPHRPDAGEHVGEVALADAEAGGNELGAGVLDDCGEHEPLLVVDEIVLGLGAGEWKPLLTRRFLRHRNPLKTSE